MQSRLRESAASSSAYTFSSTSSSIPGIGYLSGKGIKWVGLKVLDAFAGVELRRRRWMISRLVKKIDEIPADDRTRWITKKQHQINRTIQDLLELSSYVTWAFIYFADPNLTLGTIIKHTIGRQLSSRAPRSEILLLKVILHVLLFPLLFPSGFWL
jgi:hypothetical protein